MTREGQLENIGGRIGTAKPVTTDDLIDNRTLSQHAFVPIYEQKGKKKRWYHVGSGVENQDTNVGRLGLDLQVADDDGGTNQADAKGVGRWAVYPDEPDSSTPKATGDEISLSKLRDSDGQSSFRDMLMNAAKKPGAQQDEYVVFEVEIDSTQDGMMVYQEGSSFESEISEVKV